MLAAAAGAGHATWAHFLVEDHGMFYGPVSGWVGDLALLSLLGGLVGVARAHNCHARGCWRVGRHPVEGTPYKTCRRHHPHVPDGGATVGEIHAAHRAARDRDSRPFGEL